MKVVSNQGLPEGHGCDLGRSGEATVILRWLGRIAFPRGLLKKKGLPEGHRSRFGEAPVFLSCLGNVASLWGMFKIEGLPEGQVCDLSQFGDALVIFRWPGRTDSPWELFELMVRPKGKDVTLVCSGKPWYLCVD